MQSNSPVPTLHAEHIRIRGKNAVVPAVHIRGRTIIRTGGWLKIAKLLDEELVQGEPVDEPSTFVTQLQVSGLGADLFTFLQAPTESQPKHSFPWVEENLAVIPTHCFKDWWENRLPQESRKNVRRAAKREVLVKEVTFDDELVRGIKAIYDEAPVRQGRPFWHYGKDFHAVKSENSTYLDRSWFLGAYYKDELIGFLKVIMVDKMATLIQILAKNAAQDKRPMNALLARAVELCERHGASYLVYGKYRYGKKEGDSLGEFKRRNGFEELRFPRYYVPLTLKGTMAVKLGAHLGVGSMLPRPVSAFLVRCRAWLLGLLWKRRPVSRPAVEAAESN